MTLSQALALINPYATYPTLPNIQTATGSLSSHHPATQTPSNENSPQHWADLGCGSGLFTEALAQLLPASSTIHAVDLKPGLKDHLTPNGVSIITQKADFIKDPLSFQNLDGILMANSLHYVNDKSAFLHKLSTWQKAASSFLIVEYDTDIPVPTWVPYPLSFTTLTKLFNNTGYQTIQKLSQMPSAFGHADLYSVLIGQS